mgnify:CR=1 FL=1
MPADDRDGRWRRPYAEARSASARCAALAGDLRHRIVRVQAFEMRDAHVEALHARIFGQRGGDAARGVFAEHQVVGVEFRVAVTLSCTIKDSQTPPRNGVLRLSIALAISLRVIAR